MKVMMLSNQGRSMAVFWRVLMQTMQEQGMQVSCCVPDDGQALQALGYPTLTYSLDRKGINPVHDLKTFSQLYGIFREHRPDLVFATTIKPVIYGCMAAKLAKIPNIFATITGLGYAFEADSPLKKLLHGVSAQLYRLSLRHTKAVFFQNRDDGRVFRQQHLLAPDARVFFAKGTGVDISHFSQALLPPLENPTFLLVGRLLAAKGIREYAAAARELKAQWPNAKFQLLGVPESGPGSISLEEVKAMPHLEYLGQTDDVRPYLAKAHVAVLPSWREGLPTSLMEAMSMGRPLVATDVPGCREVVRSGYNGFLAQARDPASLASAMRNFLEQPELVASMGATSRRMAERDFDAQVVANGILNDMARSMR